MRFVGEIVGEMRNSSTEGTLEASYGKTRHENQSLGLLDELYTNLPVQPLQT